jgi:hypothetical protein
LNFRVKFSHEALPVYILKAPVATAVPSRSFGFLPAKIRPVKPNILLVNPKGFFKHSPAHFCLKNTHRQTCFGTLFRCAECCFGTVQNIVLTKQTAIEPTKVQTKNPNSQPKPLFTQNRKYTKPRLSPSSESTEPLFFGSVNLSSHASPRQLLFNAQTR